MSKVQLTPEFRALTLQAVTEALCRFGEHIDPDAPLTFRQLEGMLCDAGALWAFCEPGDILPIEVEEEVRTGRTSYARALFQHQTEHVKARAAGERA